MRFFTFMPNVERLARRKNIKGLTKALAYKDKGVRRDAAAVLGELRDPKSVNSLILALQEDKDFGVSETLIRALGNIGDAKAVPSLIKSLKYSTWYSRCAAVEALGKIGDLNSIQALILAMEDEYTVVRGKALDALDQLGWKPDGKERIRYLLLRNKIDDIARDGVTAFEPLISIIRADRHLVLYNLDEDTTATIQRVVDVLKKIGEPVVVPLILLLLDRNEKVRITAIRALGKIGDSRAIKHLVLSLEDKERNVREAAADVLGEIKDTRAIEPLVKLLDTDTSTSARRAAARILKKIGRPALEPLLQRLESEPYFSWMKEFLIEIIGEIEAPEAIAPLVHMLNNLDNSESIQFAVSRALEKLGWEPRGIEKIYYIIFAKNLDRMSDLVKEGKAAIGAIVNVLSHQNTNENIREFCAIALEKLGWEPKDIERIYYFIAKGKWNELANAGEIAIEPLVAILYKRYFQKNVAEALQKIGNLKAVEPLLNCITNTVNDVAVSSEYRLFGDYTELLNMINIPSIIYPDGPSNDRKYEIKKVSDEAVLKMISINTPLSTNILHLIMARRDLKVTLYCGEDDYRDLKIDFENQREIAREELKRRGNPSYDPSIYFDKNAWSLP